MRLNFCYLKIIGILHPRYNPKIIGHILKNSQKNKHVCIHETMRLIIMKIKIKMKNRSHRYDVSRPSKHSLVFKTPWRRLQHVFSVTIFRLPRRLQEVLKMSWRSLANKSPKRLEDVFKTSCEMSSRRICKTSWKTKKCYAEDVLKTSSRHVLKTSWRRLGYKQNVY